MLEVRLKNQYLGKTFDFLYDISLKGKQSRHRTRFLRLVEERLNEVVQEQEDLIKEHSHLDEDDNVKILKDGKTPDIKNMSEFLKDRQVLYNEEMVFDSGDIQIVLHTIRDILDNYDGELSGNEANLYDYLCEQFKVDDDLKGE